MSGHLCTFIQQSVNKDFTDVFKHSRLRKAKKDQKNCEAEVEKYGGEVFVFTLCT